MSNKTCGDCIFYHPVYTDNGICTLTEEFEKTCDFVYCCKSYHPKNPLTNGDVIRQMSNEELAVFFEKGMCHRCIYHGEYSCNPSFCKIGIKAWLNAPADCVKQNGNDDTQADLCKADNTESEGGDE
jgi:hypothetical protein